MTIFNKNLIDVYIIEAEDYNFDLLTFLKGGALKYDLDENNPFHLKFLEQFVEIRLSEKVLKAIVSSRRNEEMQELPREDLVKAIYRGLAGFHLRRIDDEPSLQKALTKAKFSLTKGGAISG